jgi:zinc and cadmium transporter
MNTLLSSLLGALAISLISFVGIFILPLKQKVIQRIIFLLLSLSTGALLGGAFFHLLPESLDNFNQPLRVFEYTLAGLAIFFVVERILRWHHCHDVDCKIHPRHLGYLNLVGDGVHNLLDGIIIISAFSTGPVLGLPVLISIALHEIPQEIGDYGVLLYAGFTRKRALFYNFLSALTAILGVMLGYFLLSYVAHVNNFLLPFAAGGFIYIAASDLIPELHKETKISKSIISFVVFLLALIMMLLIRD